MRPRHPACAPGNGARSIDRQRGIVAARELCGSIYNTSRLLAHRRIRQPTTNLERRIDFADGSSARVYRETVVDAVSLAEPVTLAVGFRLRGVGQNEIAHAVFRRESLFNTPLFVGFPGFVSKLWLAHDGNGLYRGLYDWDGVDRAESYVRALWWPLALVSERESITYQVIPGITRDTASTQPELFRDEGQWWRPRG
ncbi:hypothetical protein [Williamsia sp. 1135]|uniref:hypothetical protein n=1 Tax=Williamsia sp. 1135 TaxID=1889262 RepID=UPI00197DE662|nr:hypothetical protein [Williamsia sp. 1135]